MGLFQAVQTALVFLIFTVIARTALAHKYVILKPFAAASLWVIFEWWQTIGWWGVPWARMPLGQTNAILLLRSASLFGSYFITFIIVSVNFFFALAILEKPILKLASTLAVSLFCLNLLLGSVVTLAYNDDGERVKAAAAQGNFSSNEKWSVGMTKKIMNVYEELTVAAANEGADIIVWPETALPFTLLNDDSLTKYVKDLARDNDITIILSAFTVNEEGDEKYNSIMEVKPDGTIGDTVYSKQRLVPFGEFVPMREFVTFIFPPLADIGMLDDDLTAGNSSVIIESDIGNIGCGLCFDSIYEKVIYDSARNGAELIVIATNDSWFSDSAALDMHNGQARLRAIESGKYVVRSANTGISSIIDPMGNIHDSLGAMERGYVISDVTVRQGNTLYTYIGNMLVYLCMIFCVAIPFFSIVCKGNINFIKKT